MRRAVLVAVVLALAPAARAQDDDEDWAPTPPRLSLTAWGGQAFATAGSAAAAHDGAVLGGDVAWRLDAVELGAYAGAYRLRTAPGHDWTTVLLARVTERFETHQGVEASFTFGAGAGRADRWIGWYQLAVGGRVALGGPFYVAGELSFEQYDLVRLAAGVGVRL